MQRCRETFRRLRGGGRDYGQGLLGHGGARGAVEWRFNHKLYINTFSIRRLELSKRD